MAESAASLIRRGAISGKQAVKQDLAVLRKTKVERADEEPFHGKQGLKDQGGRSDKGHGVARTRHIDGPDQDYGTPARASGKPSKGGQAGAPKGVKAGEIDDSSNQKPEFPRAGGSKKASKGGRTWEDGDEGSDEIDARSNQKPSFPNEGKGKKGSSKGASNNFSKKKPAKMGGMYGGGGRDTQ